MSTLNMQLSDLASIDASGMGHRLILQASKQPRRYCQKEIIRLLFPVEILLQEEVIDFQPATQYNNMKSIT